MKTTYFDKVSAHVRSLHTRVCSHESLLAFRVHTARENAITWPSAEFEAAWKRLSRYLQRICDRALGIVVGDDGSLHRNTAEDFSVQYAMYYPNFTGEEGFSSTDSLKFDKTTKLPNPNVGEHIDPSLFVAEPCANARGLEVWDTHAQRWVCVEDYCNHAEDIVLFCGKALSKQSNGEIPGTLHRVFREQQRRIACIFEQKYEMYYWG